MSLSRREFIRWLTAGIMLLHTSGRPLVGADSAQTIPAPPSLMLHSRHRRLLPEVVGWLIAEGFQGMTYLDLERVLRGETPPPQKPIIITVDDLAMDRGNPSFAAFVAMYETLAQARFPGVFGVITRPDLRQSDERWAQVAAWTQQHIELATHTSRHAVLDDPGWQAAQYDAEIGASAQMIADRTGQPVRTLITPYGSGYDQQRNLLNPAVAAACQRSGIRFVIGIVEGRQPLPLNPAEGDILYLGRTVPGTDGTLSGTQAGIARWEFWAEEQRRR